MRILCVDDDDLVLAVTADLLRALDHEVTEAIGGSRAAELIGTDIPFDLLVTDIHMPGGPGGADLAALARSTRPDLPVIYFSGIDSTAPAGIADPVLRKPCRLGELQRAIAGLA
ncbi:response regulator [Rhizorhabdus dicambivorans]|uniref:response regulator n=1 Tax=Rhizorhabdus dicambivorans TaxID=1850238 RepID=UPI00082A8EB9|nr:response regulator [Rhizorhabdus dicambivorans]